VTAADDVADLDSGDLKLTLGNAELLVEDTIFLIASDFVLVA